MYKVSERTKKNTERILGIPMSDVKFLSLIEEQSLIEGITGRKLLFSGRYGLGTGNPLLGRGKIRTIESVDAKLDKVLKL